MFVKADLMPHHIKITGIKVERLQDISDEDCLKEGIVRQEVISDESPFLYAYDAFLNGDNKYFASCWFKTPKEAFAVLIGKVHIVVTDRIRMLGIILIAGKTQTMS